MLSVAAAAAATTTTLSQPAVGPGGKIRKRGVQRQD